MIIIERGCGIQNYGFICICTGVAHVAFIFRTEKWAWVSFPSKKWTGVKLYSHKWIWIEWFTEFNIFHACFQTQEISVCWIPKTIVKSRKRNFRMRENLYYRLGRDYILAWISRGGTLGLCYFFLGGKSNLGPCFQVEYIFISRGKPMLQHWCFFP